MELQTYIPEGAGVLGLCAKNYPLTPSTRDKVAFRMALVLPAVSCPSARHISDKCHLIPLLAPSIEPCAQQAFLKYLPKEQIWLQCLTEQEESRWKASDTTVEMHCTNLWPSVRRCEGPEKKKKGHQLS